MNRATATLLVALLAAAVAGPAAASSGGDLRLVPAPINRLDVESLQRGARTFVNYCLNCHSAKYMRYNRLTDLGIDVAMVQDNLMFASDKIGDTMTVAMTPRDARAWFGTPPPDLTVIARSRASGAGSGADWLYSYLRGFYRDPARPSGWNNTVFPNAAMPHVLWQLQGEQALRTETLSIPRGTEGEVEKHEVQKLVLEKPGTLSPAEYDRTVGDLVNFLVYMGEPSRQTRIELGIYVLMFLGVLFVLAYLLKKEYWKDVH